MICVTAGFAQQSAVTTISLLVQRLHAAYRARDVNGVLALWSEKSPQRAAQREALRKLFENSEIREITVGDPELSREGCRVRIDREIGPGDANRTQLVLEYVKEEGGWKIWKETPASEDLARRLAESATEQERADLLAHNADIPAAEVATGLIDLGRGERNHGNFNKALVAYELARAIADRAEAGKVSASALNNIGLVRYDEGEYAQALETHKLSLAQSEALHDAAGMARSLNNIGTVYSDAGEFGLAWDAFQKSLELGEKLRSAQLISNATGNLGILSGKRGDYIQALAMLNRGVALDLPKGDKRALAIDYLDIGNVFLWQGDHAQAQKYFQRASDMAESAGLKPLVAYGLMSLGQVAQFEGNLDEAVRNYQKSMALLNEVGDKAYMAKLLTFIASAYSVQGQQEKALESLQKGLEIQKAIGAGAEMPLTLAQIAEVDNVKGDFQEALSASAEARRLAEASGVREAIWRANLEQGKARQGLGETSLAEAEFTKAIGTIEELRVDVAGAESEHEGFFEDKLEPYHRMIDLLAASGRNAEALQYSERAKARVLLDVFKNGRTQLSEVMSAEESERDRNLRLKLASLNAKLVRAGANSSAAQVASLTAEINRARLEFDDYETALYARHPQWKLQSGAAEPVSMNVALDMMNGSDTAFVEFAVTEKSVYVFAAGGGRPAKSKVFAAPISRKELTDRVELFQKQLADRDLGFRASAAALYELLLGPAAEVLAGKRGLVLVPDDVLWEMPFAALVNPAGQYLLEKCAISYAPSLTALKAMIEVKRQRRQSPSQTALLAMGNPTFGGEPHSRVKALYRDAELGGLPLAETEVQSLGRIYGENRSRVYIGREARESRFKREAGEPRVLHLATHGILNNGSPLYSYLLLAQDTNGGSEDGLLEAHELLQMKLRAELVVLSACETARGRVSPGEGIIGLSWALLVAGAPTTVLSQWKAESESTTRLMVAFHQNRRKQMSDAEALREAALAISKEPSFRHPFYWASFIVIGAGLD
jgi:CHAT domain-containing protein/Tfp pilus assembly protein PilF/ketosteroid isomerase-like protein